MKRFLVKTGVFVLLLLATIYLYIFLLANNEIDPYYYRFTTGKYKSLVLGTSRAAQGIEPGILNEMLHLTDNKIFNYSFTVNRTQWGDPYLHSIIKKLDKRGNSNGIFVLECNLWAFCSQRNEVGKFEEIRSAPNSIRNPTMQPNIEYFFGGFEDLNFRLLRNTLGRRIDKIQKYVNANGRFVVNVQLDSAEIIRNVKTKIKTYERMAGEYVPDSLRMQSFIKTIKCLKKYGAVYLIRMPMAEELLILESSFYPEFNNEMIKVSSELEVPYMDFTYLSNKYITGDGNHLRNEYVPAFNELLGSEIKKTEK